VAKVTWLTPFYEVWERVFGVGSCPVGPLTAALRPLLGPYTPEDIAGRLERYLRATDGRYASPQGFVRSLAQWQAKEPMVLVKDGWLTDEADSATRP